MKIKEQVFVVTGGGNGIGREVVLNLLQKGASVAAIDLSESALKETQKLAKSESTKLSLHTVDISDIKMVEGLLEAVMKAHGTVDGLINVAGIIQPFIPVSELSYEKVKQVMDVNFYGTLFMVKTFLPELLKRPEAHITNISSMGGFVPVPGQSIYGASKAAVKLMTEGLHSELKDTNVGVTIVFPGGVETNIMKNSGATFSRSGDTGANTKIKLLTAAQAAEIIVEGTRKKKYRVLAGKDAKFLDFYTRLSPKKAAKVIADKLSM